MDIDKCRNANRAVCVEDAAYSFSLPQSFQKLLSSLTEHGYEFNEFDLLAIVVFITAIEYGFLWQKCGDNVSSFDERQFRFDMRRINAIPVDVITAARRENEHSFTLYLGGREDFECRLSIKKCLDKLIVNVFAVNLMICESVTFPISSLLVGNEFNFTVLRIFCVKCKENLFYKIKTSFLKPNGIRVPCLIDLPNEVIVLICKKLQPKEFGRLCLSCRLLRDHYSDSKTLVTFFKNNYGPDVFEDRDESRKKYLHKKI